MIFCNLLNLPHKLLLDTNLRHMNVLIIFIVFILLLNYARVFPFLLVVPYLPALAPVFLSLLEQSYIFRAMFSILFLLHLQLLSGIAGTFLIFSNVGFGLFSSSVTLKLIGCLRRRYSTTIGFPSAVTLVNSLYIFNL